MIGIIGAMEEETAKIKALMTDFETVSKASMLFYKGKIKGKDVVPVYALRF